MIKFLKILIVVFFILSIISSYAYINLRDDVYDVIVTKKYTDGDIYIVIGEYEYGETKFIMCNKSDYDNIKVNSKYIFTTSSNDYVVKEMSEYTNRWKRRW